MTVTIRFLLLPLPSMLLLFLAKFLSLREHIGFTKFYETYAYECFRSHLQAENH